MPQTDTPTPVPHAHEGATSSAEIVVAGGGIGGLIAALTARRRCPTAARIVVLAGRQLGGRARADVREGFTFNRGPRALYLGGALARTLVDLGVEAPGWKANQRGGAARCDQAMHLFPSGAPSMLRTDLLGGRDKAQLAATLARVALHRGDGLDATSVSEWMDDLDLRPPVRLVVEALVRLATYADAPSEMAAGPALGNLRLALTSGVRYVDGGWQHIVDRLAAEARAAGIVILSDDATSVDVDGDRTQVGLRRGAPVRCRSVIVATGGPDSAAALLGSHPSSWNAVGPPVTAACLEMGLRAVPTRRFVLGIDEPTYLSVHAPGAALAPAGGAVVHLLRTHRLGEAAEPEQDRRSLAALAAAAGIDDGDVVTSRFLARMVVSHGVPRADRGGFAGRPGVAVPDAPGAFVVGDWVGSTGLLADAVAASAAEAGQLAALRSATISG